MEEHIKRIAECETISEARNYIINIIAELVALKKSNPIYYRNVLRRFGEPFKHKGMNDFIKEIDGYVKMEEGKARQERFNEATENKDREQFDTDENGVAIASQENIVRLLDGNKFIEFSYDNFTEQSLFKFIGEPLWYEGLVKDQFEIRYLDGTVNKWYRSSGHISELKLYLHKFFPEERSWRELDAALEVVSKRNQFDLLVNVMDHLPEWDGNQHMDFLHRYAGMQSREWATVLGHAIALTMVARCYQPGYNVRGTPILEGPENQGKSMLVKMLAFDYRFFSEFSFGKSNEYEPARQFRGLTIVEIPDKGNIDSKTNDQIKAFITLTHDVNRRMHSDTVEHLPRRFGMMVTCNESGPYLKGEAGGDTRWLPGKCVGQIDFEAVRQELPQILAQAKYLFEYDNNMPRLTRDELVMQQEYLAPRQIKPDHYYWILDVLKFRRNEMFDLEKEWDEGFTMNEMLGWCEGEDWLKTKNKTHHRREITNVLRKYFRIDNNTTRAIPVHNQKDHNGSKTIRKWWAKGTKEEWNEFLDNLED